MQILLRSISMAALASLTVTGFAQQNHAPQRLLMARSTYYTPTANGLKSFHCTVGFDWKDYLKRFGGGGDNIADDNPALVYLSATKLSTSDDLQGTGALNWVNHTTIPEGKEAAIQQIRSGMMQMFSSYFSSWNAYMNGTMVPIPDASVSLAPDNDGISLHSLGRKQTFEEKYDKNMLLLEVHVVDEHQDITAYPTYQDSPNGRIVSSIRSIVHMPPTAPATDLTLFTTYGQVGSFQLPSGVAFHIQNIGDFSFTFSECGAETLAQSPTKSSK